MAQYTFRIVARTLDGYALEDASIDKTQEILVRESILNRLVDKTQEILVAKKSLPNETIEKTQELFVVKGSPQDATITKTQELLIRKLESIGPIQARIVVNTIVSQLEVEERARVITFIKDPRKDLFSDIKVSAKSIREKFVENFDIIFDNIFNQKVDAESEEKNQFDSFCTVLWVGAFDKLTRFGMAFGQLDGDGNTFNTDKPVDLSLPKTTNINPTLQWSRPGDPDKSNNVFHSLIYELEVADNFRMRKPIYVANVTPFLPADLTIQHIIPIDLEVNKTYYWRVRAIDRDLELASDPYTAQFAKQIYSTGIDMSDWTNIFSFKVVEDILDLIPSIAEVDWNHPFLLPPGQEFYFWDVRNLQSVDSFRKPIRYRPVVYQYSFGNGINDVATRLDGVQTGIEFFINHFAANPPIFISSQYDSQTHNVVFRVLISDSLSRRYQLSDFAYLDRKTPQGQFITIPDAQILGKKKDLQSDILNTTNMGLFTWDRAADSDVLFDQELVYNPRVLSEPKHRNNNFYYLIENLTTDKLYNIITTNFLDFGAFWGNFFDESSFPRLKNTIQFEGHDFVDIRFMSHGWKRIQIEVLYPGSDVIQVFDTSNFSDPSIGDFLAALNIQSSLILSDSLNFSNIKFATFEERTTSEKVFDITEAVSEIINSPSYPELNEKFHIFVEVNWGPSSHSWGILQLSPDYNDSFNDTNIIKYSSIDDSGDKSLLLNSHVDHTRFYFTNLEVMGNEKGKIPIAGIVYDSKFKAKIILPDWVPNNIEYRVRLMHIPSPAILEANCLFPVNPEDLDEALIDVGYMSEMGIILNPPYGVDDFDVLRFEYRIRGIPNLESEFGDWSRKLTGIKFADTEKLDIMDDDATFTNLCTYPKLLNFSSIYSPVAAQIIVFNGVDIYDSFLSVDDNGDNVIFENDNKNRNWRPFTQLFDWDYKSNIRVKLRKNYFALHDVTSFEYTINLIEPDSTVTFIDHIELNNAIFDRVIQPKNENITSAIIKDFENENVDNEPLITWFQTRTKHTGRLIVDLVNTYFIQEIEFDFISFPDEMLRIEYHNPDDDTIKLMGSTSGGGLYGKIVSNNLNITADRIEITVISERPVTMKLPKLMGYRLAPEDLNLNELVFVDTEITDIVMQNWSAGTELDAGIVVDPNVEFELPEGSPVLGKYTTYRDKLNPIRVSLYRDNQAKQLLHVKNGREFNLIFTNIELFQNNVTNIVLDFRDIEETFYELRYSDVELLESKINTADFFVAVRAFDGIEYSHWSEFAKTRPANIHTLLWNISGSDIEATEKMLFRCRATISSASTEMSTPVMGFIDFAGTNLQKIEAELDVTDLLKQQLQKIKTEFQGMINNRIDPENPNLNFSW